MCVTTYPNIKIYVDDQNIPLKLAKSVLEKGIKTMNRVRTIRGSQNFSRDPYYEPVWFMTYNTMLSDVFLYNLFLYLN